MKPRSAGYLECWCQGADRPEAVGRGGHSMCIVGNACREQGMASQITSSDARETFPRIYRLTVMTQLFNVILGLTLIACSLFLAIFAIALNDPSVKRVLVANTIDVYAIAMIALWVLIPFMIYIGLSSIVAPLRIRLVLYPDAIEREFGLFKTNRQRMERSDIQRVQYKNRRFWAQLIPKEVKGDPLVIVKGYRLDPTIIRWLKKFPDDATYQEAG